MSTTNNSNDLGESVKSLSAEQEVFGRYKLIEKLGSGGMGVVWLAEDSKLDDKVALKFLPESVRSDEAAIKDLKKETKRSRELSHKNIVRIYDVAEDDSLSAIVMEYVDGQTLQQLRLGRPNDVVPESELVSYARSVAEAIDYAHSHGQVVHRDIKPANILITQKGDVKVADFGVARSLCDTQSRKTGGGAASGTVVYMSPQQLMGEHPAPADDIYSLGATLYEALVAKPPFHTGDVSMQIMHKSAPKVNEERAMAGMDTVVEGLAAGIAACLEKEADKRPASGAALVALLDGKAAAPVDSFTTPAAAAVSSNAASEAGNTGAPAEEKKGKGGLIAALLALGLIGGGGWYVATQTDLLKQSSGDDPVAKAPEKKPEAPKPWIEFVAKAKESEEAGDLAEALKWWQEAKQVGGGVESVEAITRIEAFRQPISIKGSPAGAEVMLNGEKIGELPYEGEVGLGKHSFTIQKSGFSGEDVTEEFEVKGEIKLSYEKEWLTRDTGGIKLSANLKATQHRVRMVESAAGDAEEVKVYNTRENLPTGRYEVSSSYVGLNPVVKQIDVVKGETVNHDVKMLHGGFKIATDPSRASVYVDGKYVGMTPYTSSSLMKPGVVNVEVRKHNYKTKKGAIRVPSNGSVYNMGTEKLYQRDPIVWKVPSGEKTVSAALRKSLSGDTIEIAAGTYTEQLVVSFKKNITIRGAGSGRTVFMHKAYGDGNLTYNVGRISDSENITLKGITFKHTSTHNGKDRQPNLLSLQSSKNIRLEDLQVYNGVGHGIVINATSVKVHKCYARYNKWCGSLIVGKKNSVAITSSHFSSNGNSGLSANTSAEVSGYVSIRDSYFQFNKSSGIQRPVGTFGVSVNSSTISSNSFTGVTFEGKELASVNFCRVYKNGGWGIFANSGFVGTVHANSVYENGSRKKGIGGIGMRGRRSRPTLTNNKSYKNNGPGIGIEAATMCRKFEGNQAWSTPKGFKDVDRNGQFSN